MDTQLVMGSSPIIPMPWYLPTLNQRGLQFPESQQRSCGMTSQPKKHIDVRSTVVGKTNPPPVCVQKASRARNPKTQRSGNAEVGRTFGDTVHNNRFSGGGNR